MWTLQVELLCGLPFPEQSQVNPKKCTGQEPRHELVTQHRARSCTHKHEVTGSQYEKKHKWHEPSYGWGSRSEHARKLPHRAWLQISIYLHIFSRPLQLAHLSFLFPPWSSHVSGGDVTSSFRPFPPKNSCSDLTTLPPLASQTVHQSYHTSPAGMWRTTPAAGLSFSSSVVTLAMRSL